MRAGLPPLKARKEKACIALIGECLIELNGTPFGTLHQTFGGDTLNTALYLARLMRREADVKYVTAIGTDAFSDGMLRRWQAEGIDTALTLRDPARLPGLYMIQVDDRGERTFSYWRKESAARYLLQHPAYDRVTAGLAEADLVYLTGISLAVLPEEDRAALLGQLKGLASLGKLIVFDTNYRPALWASTDAARAAGSSFFSMARLVFVTFDDEQRLWGDATPEATLMRLHAANAGFVVVKLGAAGCLFSDGRNATRIAAAPVAAVTDTTAAGDAFNAGFLAAWLREHTPEECCRAANALAGAVIQHRGAIIPANATPSLMELLRHYSDAGIAP